MGAQPPILKHPPNQKMLYRELIKLETSFNNQEMQK